MSPKRTPVGQADESLQSSQPALQRWGASGRVPGRVGAGRRPHAGVDVNLPPPATSQPEPAEGVEFLPDVKPHYRRRRVRALKAAAQLSRAQADLGVPELDQAGRRARRRMRTVWALMAGLALLAVGGQWLPLRALNGLERELDQQRSQSAVRQAELQLERQVRTQWQARGEDLQRDLTEARRELARLRADQTKARAALVERVLETPAPTLPRIPHP